MSTRILALLACTGCTDTAVQPTLLFARLDDDAVTHLVTAASGGDADRAIRLARDFAMGTDPSCPFVETVGNVVTVTGGCMTASGIEIRGVVQRTIDRASTYVFDAFEVARPGGRVRFDGTVYTDAAFIYAVDGEMHADLTARQEDRIVRSRLVMRCSDRCTVDDGVELIGAGGAIVEGAITSSGIVGNSGGWRLHGIDWVEVSMVPISGTETCLQWRIAGTDRSAFPFGCPR